jgi:hypothetical protein
MDEKNLVLEPPSSATWSVKWSTVAVIKTAVIAAFGLAALVVIVRSGYTFRGEGHGVKIEITPPETPKLPRPER